MVSENSVVDSKDKLLNRLAVLSRPVDRWNQNVEETYSKLIEVLNEALASTVIDDSLLSEILETIERHFEAVREEFERVSPEARNLMKLHQTFYGNLIATFAGKY